MLSPAKVKTEVDSMKLRNEHVTIIKLLYEQLSPNFASAIKQIQVNLLTLLSLKSSKNLRFYGDLQGNRS